MRLRSSIATAFILLASLHAQANPFWAHWSDGKAELSGFRLVQPRYGELRKGTVVLVYVTEPYSRKEHVKVDDQDASDPDQASVLKLNVVRDFQTGIYDYNTMTSVFADPAREFRPLEVTFSMQEWCGHVYEEALFEEGAVELATSSYFQGESQSHRIPLPAGTVVEDALLIALRSLDREELAAASVEAKLMPAATYRRLRHAPAELADSRISWGAGPHEMTVPAGKFYVRDASYRRADGETCTIAVETAYPHRIVGWSCTDGEKSELLGSKRLPYWKLNSERGERELAAIGLPVPR